MMSFALMLALLAAGSPAATPTEDSEADLRCMAILSATLGRAPEAQRAGMMGGVMFFYGRIVGRTPNFDVEAGMVRLVAANPDGKALMADGPRCADEMVKRGTYLQGIGKRIAAQATPK